MSKTKLETPKNRLSLAPGKFHSEKLLSGSHLLYKRPETDKGASKLPGTWSVRLTNHETGSQKKKQIGTSDDLMEADGLLILSYEQAKIKAESTLKELALVFEEGLTGKKHINIKDYTVKDACNDYLEHLRLEGKHSYKIMKLKIEAHIIPFLGDIKVSRLTKDKVDEWKSMEAERPRKVQYKVKGNKVVSKEGDKVYSNLSEDAKRKRRGSANNNLEILKTALNYAVVCGKAESPGIGSWKYSQYFKGTRIKKTMFLTQEEQIKLIQACDTIEFSNLVKAALYTGGRISELTNLVVNDFNEVNGTILFGPYGKMAGKQRYIYLSEEAVEFFKEVIKGKSSNEIIFTRPKINYQPKNIRENKDNKWLENDHIYYMKKACKLANIKNFTFHGLRHTFASVLVNKGVPLVYVANQLGHSSINLVQSTYGHLAPTEMANILKKSGPSLNTQPAN
jgi:integrase